MISVAGLKLCKKNSGGNHGHLHFWQFQSGKQRLTIG
jgi:hypothetical protein